MSVLDFEDLLGVQEQSRAFTDARHWTEEPFDLVVVGTTKWYLRVSSSRTCNTGFDLFK